ncbi:arsenic resistance N-acetyltransferase ArsN2 [Fulvimonas yonginensis]|uniref:Arsenic resistance N-acetyltransferase ArsN2 n=1 Tax=Fulvimonas yonginensis TaxID=1495200 RepID=A0ABU8JEW2_9GAMM
MELRHATAAEQAPIHALLARCALPTGDLAEARVDFVVAVEGDRLVGAVGLQQFGDTGLLRSLAVEESARGAGIGARLVRALEALARERGLRQLVLLTQTAEAFFAGRGYAPIDRQTVPARVQASAEFRSLCPASATCMTRTLEDAA